MVSLPKLTNSESSELSQDKNWSNPVDFLKDKPYLSMVLICSLASLLLFTSGLAFFYYYKVSDFKKNPEKIAQEELKKIVTNVSKLIDMPEGELPTIAMVSDPEKLRNQPFFARAKKGDKVLMFTNARKAILYNPETNKIIEVAPLNIGGSSTPLTPIPSK